MGCPHKHRARGFTLAEMMIALFLGVLVLGVGLRLYSSAVYATTLVSQRAEMQQDFRGASNLLLKDISLAGSGLGDIGIALPSGNSVATAIYGCDTAGCYINGGAVAFPTPPGGGPPTLYGVVPGYQYGIKVNGSQSDTISIAYTDTTFLLNCYSMTVTSSTKITFTDPTTLTPAKPYPSSCVFPPSLTAPQAVNDSAVGLTQGDLVLFQINVTTGSGASATTTTVPVVGEVTSVPTGSGPYTITFANGATDPMKMNQPTAAGGSLAQYVGDTGYAARLYLITYYLDISPNGGVTPRLMRKVSGHPSVPVAENIVQLNFTYDLFNNGVVAVGQGDGGASLNLAPTLITKINLTNLTIRSQTKGLNGYQGLNMQTSISARNLTFTNNYPIKAN